MALKTQRRIKVDIHVIYEEAERVKVVFGRAYTFFISLQQ